MKITKIKTTIESVLKKHNIKKKDLYNNGAIYYFNGNDGTRFDFLENNQTCEFIVFYKSTKMGAVQLNQWGDKFLVYVFDKKNCQEVIGSHTLKSPYSLEKLCKALEKKFDANCIFNKAIKNWDID